MTLSLVCAIKLPEIWKRDTALDVDIKSEVEFGTPGEDTRCEFIPADEAFFDIEVLGTRL